MPENLHKREDTRSPETACQLLSLRATPDEPRGNSFITWGDVSRVNLLDLSCDQNFQVHELLLTENFPPVSPCPEIIQVFCTTKCLISCLSPTHVHTHVIIVHLKVPKSNGYGSKSNPVCAFDCVFSLVFLSQFPSLIAL